MAPSAPAVNGRAVGFLFRPTVVQISRWDRLKGFGLLMEAFLRWKQEVREFPG